MKLFKHPALAFKLFPIFAALFVAGCGVPLSQSTGQKMLENQIQNQSNGKIKLLSFSKTNGKGDDAYYQVEYEAEIEFLANGAWESGGGMSSSPTFGFSTQQLGGGATAQLLGAVVGAQNVSQGQRTKVKGVLRFEKTEKGWRGQDGQVY